jgi:hypothetical protein
MVVVRLSEYRVARRATEVLRGLLRDVPGVVGVAVSLEAGGSVAAVVTVRGLAAEIIRSCIPTAVNKVPVRVRSV